MKRNISFCYGVLVYYKRVYGVIRGEILPSVRGLSIYEGTGGGIGSGWGHNIKYWGTRSGIGSKRHASPKDQFE